MNDKNALIFHSIAVPNSDYGSESRQSFKKMTEEEEERRKKEGKSRS